MNKPEISSPSMGHDEYQNDFLRRHIGLDKQDQEKMLADQGAENLEEFISQIVPSTIRRNRVMQPETFLSEAELKAEMHDLAAQNHCLTSLIGQGYYAAYMPAVIKRNVFENAGWYTSYTPYQPEISQGRLEALLNFQTMITDLTGLGIANASLLDEATACGEAMFLALRAVRAEKSGKAFFVAQDCHPQNIENIKMRAAPLDIKIIVGDCESDLQPEQCFAALLQYPASEGQIRDYALLVEKLHKAGALAIASCDLLALTLLRPPGEWGADIAVGSTQRFGMPIGFGGPHAGFIAAKEEYTRLLPGRLVGVSRDRHGQQSYRLTLQTREQHIRREKATSNICTAQALPAIISMFYACWHGARGLQKIARHVHNMAVVLSQGLAEGGFVTGPDCFFDTITVAAGDQAEQIHKAAIAQGINIRRLAGGKIGISCDETTNADILRKVWKAFGLAPDYAVIAARGDEKIAPALRRKSDFLTHPVFYRYRSETEMLRYMRVLVNKDIALDRSMIPLGSCTMKLNAAIQMEMIGLPGFSEIHPFAPLSQVQGYLTLIERLEDWLCDITGYDAISLQPNAGAQGEYAGLLAIRSYHHANGQTRRNICLIPSSAHGTNPASAKIAGFTTVIVRCDEQGNVDLADFRSKIDQYKDVLAAAMITYPSTHGVFEETIAEISDLVHQNGGQLYLDGANMNALMGLAEPGKFGADVGHLNLHKTFCIPHGGGGPGVGPVGVKAHLAPFLPGPPAFGGCARTPSQNWPGDRRGAIWFGGHFADFLCLYPYVRRKRPCRLCEKRHFERQLHRQKTRSLLSGSLSPAKKAMWPMNVSLTRAASKPKPGFRLRISPNVWLIMVFMRRPWPGRWPIV